MMRQERLNFHPLENTATTNIAREDLTASSTCGHQPSVLAVAQSDQDTRTCERPLAGLENRALENDMDLGLASPAQRQRRQATSSRM
jgi:hypothetical protein